MVGEQKILGSVKFFTSGNLETVLFPSDDKVFSKRRGALVQTDLCSRPSICSCLSVFMGGRCPVKYRGICSLESACL